MVTIRTTFRRFRKFEIGDAFRSCVTAAVKPFIFFRKCAVFFICNGRECHFCVVEAVVVLFIQTVQIQLSSF